MRNTKFLCSIFLTIFYTQIVFGQNLSQNDIENKTSQRLAEMISRNTYIANKEKKSFSVGPASVKVSVNDAEIKMFFSADDLDAILKEKQFLNGHQVGKSNGNDRPDLVKKIENGIAGIKLESTDKKVSTKLSQLRPKYAIIDFPDLYKHLTEVDEDENFIFQESYKTQAYGQISAVFKSKVKQQTTISLQDSGDYIHEVRNRDKLNQYFTGLNGQDQLSINPYGLAGSRYIEAQVWGKLALSDVEFFILDTESLPSSEIFAIVDRLKEVGVPIYAKAKETEDWMTRFEYFGKGENLFRGKACDQWFEEK